MANGERSALAEALYWAERVGVEVYGASVHLAERDAEVAFELATRWGMCVTQTEITTADWASFWLGRRPVPDWPDDGAEPTRWAQHLPGLFSQRQLALRLLCRRLVRLASEQVPPFKKAFLRALRAHPSAEREAVRTQFYAELRAAAAERVVRRADLGTAHLGAVLGVGEEERAGIERRHRRPTVRELRSKKDGKS